jgi:hypothetical protein
MSNNVLNFAELLDPEGAHFPTCCTSGFWVSYNTHLRDPMKLFVRRTEESPETLVNRKLARSKKRFTKR